MDETEFACSEKKRILLKLKPPGSENAHIDNFVPIFRKGEYKIGELPENRVKKGDADDNRRPKNDF